MKMQTKSVLVAAAVTALTGAGCDDSDVGVVRQRWTIEGNTNPQSCAAVNATQMRMVAIDPLGIVRGTDFTACTSFLSTVRLVPGTYSIAATFLGADGRPVSGTLIRDGVSVHDDEDTSYTIDFPRSTFLTR